MPLVTIQLGQCGNQLGSSFFQTLGEELSAHDYGTHAVSEFFRPNPAAASAADVGGRTRPMLARALLVDMEPKVVDAAYASTMRPSSAHSGVSLQRGSTSSDPNSNPGWWWSYAPENRLCQQGGAGNNWALGFHGFGPMMEDPLMDLLRKEVEHCDCLSGFLLVQSSAGGTGAGFGTYAAQTIRDAFPEAHILSCCVWPYETGEVVVQPYNTLLTLANLTSSADGVILLENDQLHRMCQKVYDVSNPSFANLNNAAARSLAAMLLPSQSRSVAGSESGSGSGSGSKSTGASGERTVHDVSKRLAEMQLRNQQRTSNSNADVFGNGGNSGGNSGSCSLADLLGHLCAHPTMRLLTLRSAPQVAPNNVPFTSFAWPAILKRMRQMLLTGSVVEAGMDWAVDLGSIQRRAPYHPLLLTPGSDAFGPPPPSRNVSLADWIVLRGQNAGSADVSEIADPRLHASYSVDPLQVSSCAAPYSGCRMHASMLSNDQRCVAPMQLMQETAYSMLSSKAFLHQYQKYGMDEEEFTTCFDSIEEILERYRLLSRG